MGDTAHTRELAALRERIVQRGFALVAGTAMRPLVGPWEVLADWNAFAESWNDLPLDTHLPDGHRYRRRRYATLSAKAGVPGFERQTHQPHYQAIDYNKLVGGIERWFEPIAPQVVAGPVFHAIIDFCLRLYSSFRPQARWHIECHQFRIEARPDSAGLPTPEGVHRDGVDYVLVMLVDRVNIESGTTTVHAPDGHELGSFTLAAPFDAALVDDARVMHGVTAVRPMDPARPAFRDVLVVTLKEQGHPREGGGPI